MFNYVFLNSNHHALSSKYNFWIGKYLTLSLGYSDHPYLDNVWLKGVWAQSEYDLNQGFLTDLIKKRASLILFIKCSGLKENKSNL